MTQELGTGLSKMLTRKLTGAGLRQSLAGAPSEDQTTDGDDVKQPNQIVHLELDPDQEEQ